MGCDDDAELLQQVTEPDGSVVIRLMWSYMCQGVWAKISRDLDTSPDYVYGTLWTTRDPEGGVQQADTTGLLADGVAGDYTKMQNWKKTSAKACWNDVDAQYDPMPLRYIVNNNDASMPTVHGSCTDWL